MTTGREKGVSLRLGQAEGSRKRMHGVHIWPSSMAPFKRAYPRGGLPRPFSELLLSKSRHLAQSSQLSAEVGPFPVGDTPPSRFPPSLRLAPLNRRWP